MLFTETTLRGAYLIESDRFADERGFFARTWCADEFAAHDLPTLIAQCNVSFNKKKGTLRGMHFQTAQRAQAKLVSCTAGAIYDVTIDLRPDSATFKEWVSVELTPDNGKMLYIPAGFAHGFQTLLENTAIFYQMFEFYHPETAQGVRWNDPAFGITWPETETRTILPRDASYPDFAA